jgi:DNA repair exonuclease SbcCD nuclease subunit
MKRTRPPAKINKPNAILTSDWHLREDVPVCREDNFPETQWKKVEFVKELQKKYKCSVLHAGDLFHHWKPSPYLLSQTIMHLPEDFWTVLGQHDLPQHSLELVYKCGVSTLSTANRLHIIAGGHWNTKPGGMTIAGREIAVWHVMNYAGKPPWPGCDAPRAGSLLKKYPQYDLIVTGDNHKPFVEEYEGRLLVNPGSLTRQSADEDHEPRIYLWYAKTNIVEPVYLPLDKNAVTREHIEQDRQRDERIEAFVQRLNTDFEASISFEENLERFLQSNRVTDNVKQIIYKATEDD